MKHFKLFFACLLMAVLSIGQVWAVDNVTIEKTMTQIVTANSYTVSAGSDITCYTSFALDGSITISTTGTANCGSFWGNTTQDWRLYQNRSGNVIITAADGCTLKKVTITYSVSNTGTLKDGTTTIASGAEQTITGSSKTYSVGNTGNATNGQVRITKIKVIYTPASSGSTNPTVYVDPASWDFGTVHASDAASKVFSVSGSNLTEGTLTLTVPTGFSVSPTSIAVNGTLAATNVTVSKNTSSEDDYAENLIISGGGQETAKTVALTMTVDADPEPTGTFNKYTGTTLTEGDYVVTYGTYTLKNEISSNRWANGSPITSGASSLEDPDASVIWHIAPIAETSYWTLYNEAAHKYAAGNNTKNNGALVDMPNEGASDMMKWSATYVATSTWDFENYGRSQLSSNSGNKYLRNNGDNGWAPYASSTNAALTLYKKVVSSEVTISAPSHTTLTVRNSSNVAVASGASIAEGARLYVGATSNDATAYRVAAKAYKTGDESTVVTIDATDSITMPGYPITITADETTLFAVNVAVNDNNMGSATMDGGTATVYKANNETVTLVATPESGHEFVNWTATDGIVIANATALSTTATIGAAGTITANFQAQGCSNLDAPTLNSVTKSYETATIAWNTVEHASSYAVSVVNHTTSESVFSGVVTELSKELTDLAANTQYDYTIMAKGDGSTYCDDNNPTLAGDFTTNEYPAATLTLSDAEGTSLFPGDHKLKDVIQLPSTAASCSKTFVGWSTNGNCSTAPEYAKGANFTLSATSNIVYAVYADVTGGGTSTTNIAYNTETTTNMTEDTNEAGKFNLDADEWSVVGAKGGNSNNVGLNKAKDIRLYWADGGGNTLTITAPQTITSVGLTFTGDSYNNAWVKVGGETVTLSDGVYPINATTFVIGNNNSENAQVRISNIAVNFTTAGTQSNWSTTCTAAPTATPALNSLEVSAAGVNDATLGVTYDNVNLAGVSVDICNDDQGAAFTGDWLTATIAGEDKHIEYTVQANTSYNDARTAYIQLTAPETSDAASPAVVYIEVTQAKKPAVFNNLADLAAVGLNSGTQVTVTFEEVITNVQTISGPKRAGVMLTTPAGSQSKAIEIFYNQGTTAVPAEWQIGGKLAATSMSFTWTLFSGNQWELIPLGDSWTWDNGDLTYTAPKAISSVVVTGGPTKTTYVDGEKFNPAGLTVTVNYNDATSEVNPTGVTFACTPVRVAKSDDPVSVSVVATFNEIDSDPFEVTGLTVGDIQPMSIEDFIAAGGARCYLEGTVGTIDNNTYGNFWLTDATSSIYVYGCLTPAEETGKFNTLGVSAGDKIKVIAEEYLLYQKAGDPDKDEAKNVVFVSKISPVEITISDKNLYVNDTWTIQATTNPAAAVANISYSIKTGSDACIDETELASGVVKAIAEGDATIIATIPDGDGYLENSVEFEVHVSPAIVRTGMYVKVTNNADLTDGEYLIVYETGSLAFDGSLQTLDASSNNFAVTIESNKIIATAEIDAKSFTIDVVAGTIKSASGKFIGRTANSNGMNESSNDEYTNALSIDNDGNAVIVGSAGAYMRYNANSGQERFRYFKSDSYTGQKAIQLYKKMDYTRTVSGNYGTICLPNGGVLTNGALYEIAEMDYLNDKPNKIYFDEVEGGVMVAGKPYIFKPNDGETTLRVVYMDTENASAGHYKGLYGMYDKTKLAANVGNYILKNNQYYYVNSNNVYCDANRAYIKLSEVPAYDPGKPAYGRRRIALNVNNEQVATGMDELNASEAPVKIMVDGQLFILRGEKMYDATGRLVK